MQQIENQHPALNVEQSAAAYHEPKGVLLIKALAGSGKTRVLRHRVPFILKYRDAHWDKDSKVLLMAFGKDVAAEIQEAFKEELSEKDQARVDVATFHKHATRMIFRFKRESLVANTEIQFRKDWEVHKLLSEHAHSKGWRVSQASVKALLGMHSQTVNMEKVFSEVWDAAPKRLVSSLGLSCSQAKTLIDMFWDYRLSTGNLTFDDILPIANALPKDCFRRIGYQDVLADELQDLNFQQRTYIKNFMQYANSFTGVGDVYQAIFGYNGSDDKIFDNMLKDYPNAKILTLKKNYRSAEPILELGNKVLEHELGAADKLEGIGRSSSMPMVYTSGQDGLVEWIKYRHISGEKWKDIAILYRAKRHSIEVEMALANAGIPYVLAENSFFDQAVVQDLISYFYVFAHPNPSKEHFMKLFDPWAHLGRGTAGYIWKVSGERPITNWNWNKVPSTCRTREQINSFYEFAQHLGKVRNLVNSSPLELAKEAFEIFYEHWLQEYSEDFRDLQDKISTAQTFVEWVSKFPPSASCWDVAKAIEKQENTGRVANSDEDAVQVMTTHKSKGRQWNSVAVWKLGEGTFPLKHPGTDHNEERRLLYVAVTRAKNDLALICCGAQHRQSTLLRHVPDSQAIITNIFEISDNDADVALEEWKKMFGITA